MTESDQLTLTTAEPQPNQIQKRGCKSFNGLDGEYGKSASLWLAHMDRHRDRGSSPSVYFQRLDFYLEGEAHIWVENTPAIRDIIYLSYIELATESDIDIFQRALRNRFKPTRQEAFAMHEANPSNRFLRLYQGKNGLKQWFRKALDFLVSLNGCDGPNEILSQQEISLRDIVIRRFVIGLSSQRLQIWLLQQRIFELSISLHEAFRLAEEGMAAIAVEYTTLVTA